MLYSSYSYVEGVIILPENDLSRKIRDLRAMHELTLEQVAQQVGVGRSTVRKWETGMIANMRRDKIEKLAKALHTTPGYLMGWETEDCSVSASLPDNITPMPEMRKIPLVGTIACGEPILAEENIEEYVSIPKDLAGDFALTCKGDSMINARIFDGDIVYIRQHRKYKGKYGVYQAYALSLLVRKFLALYQPANKRSDH